MWQPAYSPDLNPIEHIWARVKRTLADTIFRDECALRTAVLREWDEINKDKEFLRGLVSSMPRRCNAVLAAGGGETKY